jgi:hypothetical protein
LRRLLLQASKAGRVGKRAAQAAAEEAQGGGDAMVVCICVALQDLEVEGFSILVMKLCSLSASEWV